MILARNYWRYGTNDDGYLCGATDDVKNEIKRHNPEHQKLIYKNVMLEHDDIINGTVRLNDNDWITVIFNS